MKWPYGQFLGLAAFEPCENSRGAIIKEGNEVGEANEGMDFLPINAANPFTVKVFRGHLFGICSGGGVSNCETCVAAFGRGGDGWGEGWVRKRGGD